MDSTRQARQAGSGISRRQLLGRAAGAAAAVALAAGCSTTPGGATAVSAGTPVPQRGRLKQSLCLWCYEKPFGGLEGLCQGARELGCQSIELVDPKDWPTLQRYGLVCALTTSHWFDQGMNNPKYHAMCLAKMRQAIDQNAAAGFPNVMTFTGFREDIADEAGIRNCVAGYKQIVGYAEEKKVTLCLEMLNSRVAEEMKGHPGYQGDHLDYVMQIVRQVGSPRLKLLFDVYHVQVMDGDVIRRMRECLPYIGHVHAAGNPGRGNLDDQQEINYRAVFRTLADLGYQGYVGYEFIPTGDPKQALRQAVELARV